MSFLKNWLYRKSSTEQKKYRIDDHFSAQMIWFPVMGVWRKNFTIKYVPEVLTRAVNWTLKRLIFLCMVHLAILFSLTAYINIQNNDLANTMYALSQAIIFIFISFTILYFQLREETVFKIIDYINGNFRYRSARGKRLI